MPNQPFQATAKRGPRLTGRPFDRSSVTPMSNSAEVSQRVRSRTKTVAVLAVLGAVGTAWIIAVLYLLGISMQARFHTIERGASEDAVRAKLGKPDREEIGCGDHLYWGDDGALLGGNDGSCHDSFWYNGFIEQWQVGFDFSRHAVHKYHYISP